MNIETLKKKYCVAVTGGIATGKSTLCQEIKRQGYLVVDADQMARKAVAPGSAGLKAIEERIGADVLTPDSDGQLALDRSKMKQRVFANQEVKRILEEIVHGEIHRLVAVEPAIIKLMSEPALWFYEAALIYETNTQTNFREVWSTWCDKETQIARIRNRDNLDTELIDKILRQQMDSEEKCKRANCCFDTSVPVNPRLTEEISRLDRELKAR